MGTHKKTRDDVEETNSITPKTGQTHTVLIPDKCHNCNGETFYVWGTRYPDKTRIEVRCMRCGKPQRRIHHIPR